MFTVFGTLITFQRYLTQIVGLDLLVCSALKIMSLTISGDNKIQRSKIPL
jgi:hypothetical protein